MLHRGQTLLRKDEIVKALRRARSIWMRAASGSREAKRAAETVSFVLSRAGDGHAAGENPFADFSNLGSDSGSLADVEVPRQNEWRHDTMTLEPTAFDGESR
jgi:hypothetical protein